MMLLDTLINFSRQFLPSHRGGTQDAPLVLNARIRAGEVDDQILDFENVWNYPLEMYEWAEAGGHHSSEVKLDNVKFRLSKGIDPFLGVGFTHDTQDFNYGVTNSSYKTIPNMAEKVKQQMDLVDKLRSVDSSDVARLIIDRHFMRDLRGNLRKFFEQEFRCVACNDKYRRPPLAGKCSKCGGKIIFTISYGSIVKYLEQAVYLANKYSVPEYIKENLYLTKLYIESVFGKETEKQAGLGEFM
jgi:DNA polymerase II large subunit